MKPVSSGLYRWTFWAILAIAILVVYVVYIPTAQSLQTGWMERIDALLSKGDTTAALAIADEQVKKDPSNSTVVHMRACVRFLAGKIEDSVVDFDRSIELEPLSKPHDWQRGIALYYAGRYEDGQEQFESHRLVNPNDVENSVWHYLCVAKARGHEQALAVLIPSGGDSRPPMMEVLEMFRGTKTPEQVIAAAENVKGTARTKALALFYGHLYVGLFHGSHGRTEAARTHLEKCIEQKTGGYMADVARIHLSLNPKTTK